MTATMGNETSLDKLWEIIVDRLLRERNLVMKGLKARW